MFEGRLEKSATLKKVLDAIKDLIVEGAFECNDEGMALQGMDSSHVSLISLLLKTRGFEKFRCDRDILLGMNLLSFSKILKCAANEDSMLIKYQEDSDVISLVFENETQDKCAEYEMKLLSLDQEHLSIPDTKFSCVITMPSSEFQRIVRDLAQFGEQILITCTKSCVQFSSNGDIGKANVRLMQNTSLEEQEAINILTEKPISLSFACKYLLSFTKATPLSNKVTLSMAEDVPLVVEYVIQDQGYIRYYLAPKIEDEDKD